MNNPETGLDVSEDTDEQPLLGLATTKELIDELAARASVSDTVGERWPSYRTVDENSGEAAPSAFHGPPLGRDCPICGESQVRVGPDEWVHTFQKDADACEGPEVISLTSEYVPEDVERLSAELHDIYQQEARRQGDVRHSDDYEALSEDTKEYDRVLARFILQREAAMRAAGDGAGTERCGRRMTVASGIEHACKLDRGHSGNHHDTGTQAGWQDRFSDPDRSYINHAAERAIQEAVDRVESMGAHPDLTAIVVALGKQREAVEAWNKRADKKLYEPAHTETHGGES